MKKLICVLLALALALSLAACANQGGDEPTNAENTSSSTTSPTGRIYYDKYGKEYESLEKMPFYDKDDNKYYIANQIEQIFVDENGKQLDGMKCFVDTHGVFVYDDENEIELIDSLSAQDKNGKAFYPASTVRWTVDNVMVNAFGLGQEIIPD